MPGKACEHVKCILAPSCLHFERSRQCMQLLFLSFRSSCCSAMWNKPSRCAYVIHKAEAMLRNQNEVSGAPNLSSHKICRCGEPAGRDEPSRDTPTSTNGQQPSISMFVNRIPLHNTLPPQDPKVSIFFKVGLAT